MVSLKLLLTESSGVLKKKALGLLLGCYKTRFTRLRTERSLIYVFLTECQTKASAEEKKLQSVIVKKKLQISKLQAELQKTKTRLAATKQELEKSTAKLMSYENIKDDKTLNFLSGVPTKALFLWILSLVKDKLRQVITFCLC